MLLVRVLARARLYSNHVSVFKPTFINRPWELCQLALAFVNVQQESFRPGHITWFLLFFHLSDFYIPARSPSLIFLKKFEMSATRLGVLATKPAEKIIQVFGLKSGELLYSFSHLVIVKDVVPLSIWKCRTGVESRRRCDLMKVLTLFVLLAVSLRRLCLPSKESQTIFK